MTRTKRQLIEAAADAVINTGCTYVDAAGTHGVSSSAVWETVRRRLLNAQSTDKDGRDDSELLYRFLFNAARKNVDNDCNLEIRRGILLPQLSYYERARTDLPQFRLAIRCFYLARARIYHTPSKPNKALSDDEIRIVADLLATGWSPTAVANFFHIPSATAQRIQTTLSDVLPHPQSDVFRTLSTKFLADNTPPPQTTVEAQADPLPALAAALRAAGHDPDAILPIINAISAMPKNS